MKVIALLAASAVSIFSHAATANQIRTKVTDISGTTFIVFVDWDTNIVTARLQANPAGLLGNALWQSLQNAVYYGSAADCSMQESGAKLRGPNEVTGNLHCKWFDKAPRPQS